MSVARAIARRLFGRSIEIIDLEIAFYKDANRYGTHGVIIASHKDLGLENQPVRFVFIGMSEPPPMTPRVIEYVWEEAKVQGFIPTSIKSYGSVLATHIGFPPLALVCDDRRRAEDVFYDRKASVVGGSMHAVATTTAPDTVKKIHPPFDSFLKKEG